MMFSFYKMYSDRKEIIFYIYYIKQLMKLYFGGVKIKMIILNVVYFFYKSLQKLIRIVYKLFMRIRKQNYV